MIITILNNFGPSIVCKRYVVSYADLVPSPAAQTMTFNLEVVPKGTVIFGVRAKHSTQFAGTGITTVTVSVGSTGASSNTTFLAAYTVTAAVADTTMGLSTSVAVPNAGTYAADTIYAYFSVTSGAGNLNALTAGSVNLDVFYWLEPDLTATAPFGVGGTAGAPTTGSAL
jgi:hypothetical protein